MRFATCKVGSTMVIVAGGLIVIDISVVSNGIYGTVRMDIAIA
jgi:hypothetical protein